MAFGESVIRKTDKLWPVAERAKELGLPLASFDNGLLVRQPEGSLVKVVSKEAARSKRLVPLFLEKNCVAVAFSNPEDIKDFESDLSKRDLELQPFLAHGDEVEEVIERLYGK